MERSVQEAIVTWACRGWPVVIIVALFRNWNKTNDTYKGPRWRDSLNIKSEMQTEQQQWTELHQVVQSGRAGATQQGWSVCSCWATNMARRTHSLLPSWRFILRRFHVWCLSDMKCTMTQICLWSLVTSDVWSRDWCLSASGCPAQKERLCCCPWKKKTHTGETWETFGLLFCEALSHVFLFLSSSFQLVFV